MSRPCRRTLCPQRRQRSVYSKLKPRLTRCPTQRFALESVAPAYHEPGHHVRGGLRQQPPSAVDGGCCRARPISRAATFAQLHNSYSDVSCSCMVDVYHCLLSMLSTTTSKVASIVPAMSAEACSSATVLYEHTLDNRFQVNKLSIGSYSKRRAIDACDRHRLTLFEA